MKLKDKSIAVAITGALYYFEQVIKQIKNIKKEGAEIVPIMTENAYTLANTYSNDKKYIEKIEKIANRNIIHTIKEAEQIGSAYLTDVLIIVPCTRQYYCKASKWNK